MVNVTLLQTFTLFTTFTLFILLVTLTVLSSASSGTRRARRPKYFPEKYTHPSNRKTGACWGPKCTKYTRRFVLEA